MKLETPALHRKYIREGKMTPEESERIMDEANKRQQLEEESKERLEAQEDEEDNHYYWGD